MNRERSVTYLLGGSLGLALLSLLAPDAALAQEVLIDPPPTRHGDSVKPALDNYVAAMQTTFTRLDTLMANPPKDPTQAQQQAEAACAIATTALEELRTELAPKGKSPSNYMVDYVKGQAAAWSFTCQQAAGAARTLAMLGDTIDIWENHWLPKLRAKKRTFRSTAAELNSAYHRAEGAAAFRSDDKRFEADLERFKPSIGAADSLGRTLVDLRDFLVDEIKHGDPAKNFGTPLATLLANLSLPKKKFPNEGIWLKHMKKWHDLLFEQKKNAEAAYKKVVDSSLSIREQTLFRTEAEPINGLAFNKIHPKFQALYDHLLGERSKIRAQIEQEERQWDRDRQRILELTNQTGAAAERALELKAAQASARTRVREAELARESATNKEEGEREYRQRMAEIEEEMSKIKQQQTEFERQRKQNGDEISRIEKENAARRKKLGMVEKPIVR